MCGIVGIVLKSNAGFFKQTEETFLQMLFADTLRGGDATGVIAVEKDGSFHIAKEASESTWFISQFSESKIMKTMFKSGKAYIGHNRKATQGKATDDNNAHPFVIQSEFAIVHNGTLFNHRVLAETDVDSEALAIVLCQAFEKADYKTALEETLGRINGAYAVAAFDQRSNKIHLFRNAERPLAIVETSVGWVFASEPAMLYWILSRNNFAEHELKIKMVPTNMLLTFDLNEYKQTTLIEEVLIPKKAIPPSTPWTKTGESTGATTKSHKEVTNFDGDTFSKNSWKRFKRAWLGKRIEFWPDDYVEEGGPAGPTVAQGATKVYLMGDCEKFSYTTIVHCLVDIKALNIDVQSLDSYMLSGLIYDMEWSTKDQILTIRVERVNRIIGHEPKQVIDAKYIQEKLDDEAKKEHEKDLKNWNSKPSQSTLH